MAKYDFDISKIKNLVFDVGSILVGYRWEDMFRDHGTDKEKALAIGKGIFDSPNWTKYDAGLITGKELIDAFCESYPEYEEEARWFLGNAIQMRVPRPRVYEHVHRLKEKGYKLYIVSNYSHDLYELHTKDLPFRQMMDGEVVSYMIHCTKPDKGIYEYLLRTYELDAKECLFFDDRLENVEGARDCGLNSVHINDGSEDILLEYLKEL